MSGSDTTLSQDACRDRLSHSRRGLLACTQRALPSVVPVGVRLHQGRLLVSVHDDAVRDQLVGQVVALSVGRHPSGLRRGWRVVVRGQLGPADDEQDRTLALEPFQLEGVALGRSR